jgi:hypothetical protein
LGSALRLPALEPHTMTIRNILPCELRGEAISLDDEEYPKVAVLISEGQCLRVGRNVSINQAARK